MTPTGSGKYDRRPRQDWNERPKRRSASQQIGALRLFGFLVLLAVVFSFTFRNFGGADDPKPTSTSKVTGAPRMAVDETLADIARDRLPRAKIRDGKSDTLLTQLQAGSAPNADVVVLTTAAATALQGAKRCTAPRPIATKSGTAYAACALTTKGASPDLAAIAIDALTDLPGRDALLTAGFDVPEVRPTTG